MKTTHTFKLSKYLILFFVFIIPVLILWSFVVEPRLIVVKKQTIDLPNWHEEHRNLKMAVLSDFHVGFGITDQKRLQEIVQKTNQQKPDFIFLLGDYINHKNHAEVSFDIFDEFKNFRTQYGIYAVMGNHESWKIKPNLRKKFEQLNIHILENKAEKVTISNKSFYIAGIQDYRTGHPDLEAVINDDGNPLILLSHNPDIFEETTPQVSLTLSGHTHGGQIYIPFLTKYLNPSKCKSNFLRGYLQRNDNHLYITSGLGTTIIPARFLVSPEIIVLKLN